MPRTGDGIARAGRLTLGLALLIAALMPARAIHAQPEMPLLARVGPWPVLSSPIGFDGRLWFINSVKWRNHNSADLYSYDPANGAIRYERHLFSQDGGQPAVVNGRLFLPFEDSRFSVGWGHFLVTDGDRWELGTIPNGQIFHTHAMTSAGRRLVASTSAWRAGLQISVDGGLTWTQIYDHPTPQGRVSRIVEMVTVGNLVLGSLVQGDQRGLLRFDGIGVADVPGWPSGRPIIGLTARDGAAYAVVREAQGDAIWRTDGFGSQRIVGPRPDWRLRDITAGRDGFWAVGGGPDGGRVWYSADGIVWSVARRVLGGRPNALVSFAGEIYVLGDSPDGGLLWGPSPPAPVEQATPPVWPDRLVTELDPNAVASLERSLKDPTAYAGRARLRDGIYQIAQSAGAGELFVGRLMAEAPERPVGLIGGRVRVSSTALRRWLLLWGMTLAGDGRVPTELITQAWTAPANSSEKYFGSPPAAMRAAAAIGQNDADTIDALMDRLDRADDPLWLRGDAVGALTDLTGQRFAYDFDRWRSWWADARAGWGAR